MTYDLLVFYSPSEITSLVSRFTEMNGSTRIATFGHSTARAAIEAGLTVNVMAPTPEYPSMTAAIDNYIKRIAAGEEVGCVTIGDSSPAADFIRKHESKAAKRSKSAASKPKAHSQKPKTAAKPANETAKASSRAKPAAAGAQEKPTTEKTPLQNSK